MCLEMVAKAGEQLWIESIKREGGLTGEAGRTWELAIARRK